MFESQSDSKWLWDLERFLPFLRPLLSVYQQRRVPQPLHPAEQLLRVIRKQSLAQHLALSRHSILTCFLVNAIHLKDVGKEEIKMSVRETECPDNTRKATTYLLKRINEFI